MPPFDRRRSFPDRTASGRTAPAVFTSDDLDRDLTALMQDPLYWRERDRDFGEHVTRQFERVHGPDGPTPDADGKRRGTLEVPRLRRRPGDERLRQPVGRDAPNKPDDVARLQRALSETGHYTFTAPRERSGVMSANLETAVLRVQRRTGLKPDGVVAPDGPTIQRVNAEAADTATVADTPATPPLPARKPGSDVTPASPDKRRTIGATREQRAAPSYQPTEADRLLSRIGNTVIDIEKIDDRIAAIEEDIRAERDRLRGHLTESAQDGSSTAKSALERLEATVKKAAKKLNPVERATDIYEIANAVKDLPRARC